MPLYHRRSVRLEGFDYASSGGYFITICTADKKCLFGEVKNDVMVLSKIGQIVNETWLAIPKHFPNVELGVYNVMPNHFHGVLIILRGRGTACRAPTTFGKPIARALPTIIRSFKSAVSKESHQFFNVEVWQRGYYEHIIKNEKDLVRIQNYVYYNHLNWEQDELYAQT